MAHNAKGEELPDDTPVEVPLRFRGQHAQTADELMVLIQRLNAEQASTGDEDDMVDYEEAELGDLPSPYELDHDVEERTVMYARNVERMKAEAAERRKAAERDPARKDDKEQDPPEGKASEKPEEVK